MPVKYLDGSFSADVRVRGSGAQPRVAGDVAVPEGSYNGLAFHAAHAAVAITRSSLTAQNGVVTVGSTHAQVAAALSVASRAFSVDVRSADANLADFNDYFDEAETLDGRGSVALALANDGRTTRTTGRVDVTGFALPALRVRRDGRDVVAARPRRRRRAQRARRARHAARQRHDGRGGGRSGPRVRARDVPRERAGAARRSRHVAAAVRHHRAGARPSRRARLGRRALAAARRERRRVAGERLDLRLRGARRPPARRRRRRARRAVEHGARFGLRAVRRERLVRLRDVRPARARDPRRDARRRESARVGVSQRPALRRRRRAASHGEHRRHVRQTARDGRLRADERALHDARDPARARQRHVRRPEAAGQRSAGDVRQRHRARRGLAAVLAAAARREPDGAAVVHARAGRRRPRAVRTVRARAADQARRHARRARRDRRHAAGAARDRQRRARERLVRVRPRPRADHQSERDARLRRHERRAAGAARERRRRNARRQAASSTCRSPKCTPATTRSR